MSPHVCQSDGARIRHSTGATARPSGGAPAPRLGALVCAALVIALALAFTVSEAAAQACPGTTLISGLQRPLGMALSNQGNLIVSESGTPTPHSGRLSILDPLGHRWVLLDGLPSGLNDVNEPSGPAGVVMRGRTVYLLMGVGDTVLPSPIPTRQLANPAVSSPLFSSVLAIHFSANVEKRTAGFTLSQADQSALAAGERITLSNGGGDSIQIELVANFPDYIPDPLPGFPDIVRGSNPFSLVVVGNDLYVTDGGRNLVWKVNLATGDFAPLATFPTVPNPLVPIGGPVVEAVPTGIEYAGGQLLVTLFSGVPFPPGISSVVQIDPVTGEQAPLITGLKTAIEVIVTSSGSYLVLQHASDEAPFITPPGVVLRFDTPTSTPVVVADCFVRPTSMVLDERSGILYVAEYLTGRVVAIQF